MIATLLAALLASAPAPSRPPEELRELVPAVDTTASELRAASQRIAVARLRAALDRQRILQDEIDAVDQVAHAIDADTTLGLMPHEVLRLRAERSLLTSQLEIAADDSLALRARLGASALDEAERPWSARRPLDTAALHAAAQKRATPSARELAAPRVDSEISRVMHAEHRLDDFADSVMPDVAAALTSALIDLPDGGSMLDVIEALERQAAVRQDAAELLLQREIALIRLEVLAGGEPSGRIAEPALGRVGSR